MEETAKPQRLTMRKKKLEIQRKLSHIKSLA